MPVFRLDFGEANVNLTVEQEEEIDVNVHVYLHPPEEEDEREALNQIAARLGGYNGSTDE